MHGVRSICRDWATERTGYPNHVVEMAFAQAVGKGRSSYRRGGLFEKRTRLMCEWERFCETLRGEGKVVPIRAEAGS